MSKITPTLWFKKDLGKAVEFYKSIFKDFKALETAPYPEGSPGTPGDLMIANFEIFGQRFNCINGGPDDLAFNESFSIMIECDGQEEVDYYWDKLLADGGEESQCGWLKDKFGLSWQVTPKQLMELMGSSDSAVSQKAMQAMLKMKKIIIADLK